MRAAALLLLLTVAAQAAPLDPRQPQLAGNWTIARTSEWPDACSLTLLKSETIGGWDVRLKRGCAKAFAWAGDITAWRMAAENELVLQDATRHGLIHFTRGEDQDWVGPGPDHQDYIITRDRPAKRKKR